MLWVKFIIADRSADCPPTVRSDCLKSVRGTVTPSGEKVNPPRSEQKGVQFGVWCVGVNFHRRRRYRSCQSLQHGLWGQRFVTKPSPHIIRCGRKAFLLSIDGHGAIYPAGAASSV